MSELRCMECGRFATTTGSQVWLGEGWTPKRSMCCGSDLDNWLYRHLEVSE